LPLRIRQALHPTPDPSPARGGEKWRGRKFVNVGLGFRF